MAVRLLLFNHHGDPGDLIMQTVEHLVRRAPSMRGILGATFSVKWRSEKAATPETKFPVTHVGSRVDGKLHMTIRSGETIWRATLSDEYSKCVLLALAGDIKLVARAAHLMAPATTPTLEKVVPFVDRRDEKHHLWREHFRL